MFALSFLPYGLRKRRGESRVEGVRVRGSPCTIPSASVGWLCWHQNCESLRYGG
jgi:hypothetical protein